MQYWFSRIRLCKFQSKHFGIINYFTEIYPLVQQNTVKKGILHVAPANWRKSVKNQCSDFAGSCVNEQKKTFLLSNLGRNKIFYKI